MQLWGCDISRPKSDRAQLLPTFAHLQSREVNDMRGILGLAGSAIVADQAQPFYKNPYILAGAVLVVALFIVIGALLLFRSSGKKNRANAAASAAGSSDWQRQGQQGMPGGWNQPATAAPANNPWGQQPTAWAAQQQPGQPGPGAWGAQGQQPANWA